MSNKILEDVIEFIPSTTKDMLEDPTYSQNLMLSISASLATLNQNGVGNNLDVFQNKDLTWDEFFGVESNYNTSHAKLFIMVEAQMEFDPPQPSTMNWLEKVSERELWRARIAAEV